MGGHCGLESWAHNSLVRHAVSHSLVGPYVAKEVVQQAVSHNAYPVLHNGTFYVHHIGGGTSNNFIVGCTNGTTPLPESGNAANDVKRASGIHPQPTVLTAATPSGPWTDRNITCDPAPCPYWSNPAVFIWPNGSSILLLSMRAAKTSNASCAVPPWHCADGGFQVAMAPTPLGPFRPVLGSWGVSPINTQECEDSYVWVNKRGYHAIFHCWGRPGGDSGGYAWSRDGVHWSTSTRPFRRDNPELSSPELPFIDTIAQSDGSTQQYYQRQRPKLVLNDDGTPAALLTGVDAKSENHPNSWQKYCQGRDGRKMTAFGCDLTITHLQLIRQRGSTAPAPPHSP